MIFNKDNPLKYIPVAYFNYTFGTGEGHLAIYSSNGVRIISIDANGNLTDRTSKVGPQLDLKKYTSNEGFFQLPRSYSKASLDEALGPEYSTQFWNLFVSGNGTFMTNKPFQAISEYLNDSPHSDITFRFRFDAKFEGREYNVVLNAYYGK